MLRAHSHTLLPPPLLLDKTGDQFNRSERLPVIICFSKLERTHQQGSLPRLSDLPLSCGLPIVSLTQEPRTTCADCSPMKYYRLYSLYAFMQQCEYSAPANGGTNLSRNMA